jgi:hypothetical protein
MEKSKFSWQLYLRVMRYRKGPFALIGLVLSSVFWLYLALFLMSNPFSEIPKISDIPYEDAPFAFSGVMPEFGSTFLAVQNVEENSYVLIHANASEANFDFRSMVLWYGSEENGDWGQQPYYDSGNYNNSYYEHVFKAEKGREYVLRLWVSNITRNYSTNYNVLSSHPLACTSLSQPLSQATLWNFSGTILVEPSERIEQVHFKISGVTANDLVTVAIFQTSEVGIIPEVFYQGTLIYDGGDGFGHEWWVLFKAPSTGDYTLQLNLASHYKDILNLEYGIQSTHKISKSIDGEP